MKKWCSKQTRVGSKEYYWYHLWPWNKELNQRELKQLAKVKSSGSLQPRYRTPVSLCSALNASSFFLHILELLLFSPWWGQGHKCWGTGGTVAPDVTCLWATRCPLNRAYGPGLLYEYLKTLLYSVEIYPCPRGRILGTHTTSYGRVVDSLIFLLATQRRHELSMGIQNGVLLLHQEEHKRIAIACGNKRKTKAQNELQPARNTQGNKKRF